MILFLLWFSMVSNPASHGDENITTDTLSQAKELSGEESLSSPNRVFTLKFGSLDENSMNKYLIIYSNVNNVWVANRNNPIKDETGRLVIDSHDGLLKILYSGGTIPFPCASELMRFDNINPRVATLLDDGNFVLRQLNSNGSINSTLWQSFDCPTDTFLPGMKLGASFRTGHSQIWFLSSWKNESVPALGEFNLTIDPKGSKQLILWRRGIVYWTSGLFRKGKFKYLHLSICYNFSYISNKDERYFTYLSNCDEINKAGLILDFDGRIIEGAEEDTKNYCVKKKRDKGCIKKESPCNTRPRGFWSLKRNDYVITGESYRFPKSLNLTQGQCHTYCLANCSCVAFGSITADGTGCEIWKEFNVTDLRSAEMRLLYIFHQGTAPRKKWWIWVTSAILGTALVSLGILFCYIKRKRLKNIKETENMLNQVVEDTATSSASLTSGIDAKTMCLFSLESMAEATNNFCDESKLGEGGFGTVYKGKLSCGQEVAIKRLSKNSGQGLVEFKNEILLIAKLQHTNLVKILGSCIQGQEMMLVYEYMQNRSLDYFLFDSSIRPLLKWTTRVNIIEGIAQGLLYLHKYSRLKVIHRDLKASNVLLDHNMHPKISDFGMARIFEVQELEANTKRIVGTHGYMPPEYIKNGIVSLKTDVFSFGVLLLEIISGKRNRGSYDINRPLNLVGLAWELWVDGRAMELIDPAMDEQIGHGNIEVMKCINIGLLCVQDSPVDRPSMTDVVSMLTTEFLDLPTPKQPAFFIQINNKATMVKRQSMNELSLSLMEGR